MLLSSARNVRLTWPLRRVLPCRVEMVDNVLSDSETVRWLNQVIENTWPICMEQIVSQKILLPIIPWFMQKYRPWTVTEGAAEAKESPRIKGSKRDKVKNILKHAGSFASCSGSKQSNTVSCCCVEPQESPTPIDTRDVFLESGSSTSAVHTTSATSSHDSSLACQENLQVGLR
nr:C2 domain-containing protein At1g53590-like isoform X1 [Ipomoea batatas]